ncbi:MAG: hypothetical protein KF752_17405 [Pirellulaceae bacterium]|nr:hypothetical protein [Pirellulaceae bacterium]
MNQTPAEATIQCSGWATTIARSSILLIANVTWFSSQLILFAQTNQQLPPAATVDYKLQLPTGRYRIEARLLFQSLSSRYLAELFEVDTPKVKHFASLYANAIVTPEVISTVTLDLNIP